VTSFQENTIELATGTLTYHVAGAGAPVIHMHAASGFRETAPLAGLAEKFRVYAPVVPGFDGTKVHDDVASMEALAALEAEFADAVIGATADVIGHSFGGWLAAWYTVGHPDKVGQLVLECPAGFREGGEGGLPTDPEEMRRALYAHPEKAPPETKPGAVLARNREILAHYHGGKPMDHALAERLGEIEALTLILHGTKDGAIPIDSPRLLKNRIPHSFLIYVYDAAHAIEVDQPEYVLNLIDDFLTRGESFLVNPGNQDAAE
jgi:pimeloyl-ACP methyl ester carboxylesterase